MKGAEARFVTLNFSSAKRQHTVLVRCPNVADVVLKICYPGAEQFEREKAFYRDRPPHGFIPKAKVVDECVVEIPFYSLPTIRQFVATAYDASDAQERIWVAGELLVSDLKCFLANVALVPASSEVDRLTLALAGLLCSGPMGTRRPRAVETMARAAWKRIRPSFRNRLRADFNSDDPDSLSWCHGDLHLNNILVDYPARTLLWIDWGRSYRGVPWSDLMYSTAMMAALQDEVCDGRADAFHDLVLRQALGGHPSATAIYRRWAPVFTLFAKANSRFSIRGRESRALFNFARVLQLAYGRSRRLT